MRSTTTSPPANYLLLESQAAPNRSSPTSPTCLDHRSRPAMNGRRRVHSLVPTSTTSRSPSPSTAWLKQSGLLLPTTAHATFNDLLLAIGGQHISTTAAALGRSSGQVKAVRQKTDSSLPEHTNHDPAASSSSHLETADSRGASMRRTSSMPLVGVDVNTGQRLRHYNYDVKLSKLQKRALRFTWHRLHTRNGGKRVENVFEEVFERMLKSMPMLRDMFTTRIFLSAISKSTTGDQAGNVGTGSHSLCSSSTATLRDHARLIVKMVDTVIKNLDTEEKRRKDTGGDFDPIRLGRAHASLRPYGFVSALWEKMGETIIDVVLGQEAVRDLPGAGQAWVVLTACLVDQLRAGFETSKELQQRQLPNTPAPSCPISQSPQKHGQDNHKQQYEAASLAAQKLLLMRSQIQQRNQQEEQQQSTPSPPKPRYSLCSCHLGEIADFKINSPCSPHPCSHLASHLVHSQESGHSVESSPSYSPSGSSNCLNQQQQSHRASWCPSTVNYRSGASAQRNHLPAKHSPSNPERDAMIARRSSSSTNSSSSISKLSARVVQLADLEGDMEGIGGSRRNSSGEVLLLTSNLCRIGPGSGGRHSHHGSSSNSSRKSTPDQTRILQMAGRAVVNQETGLEGQRAVVGSVRGSQLSINRPASPTTPA